MAEPIGPEVYLAFATSVQNAVNNYKDKKRVEQNHKLAIISTDSSKSSLTLPADELLSCSGLKIGNDGYVQWALDSPAYPRNWSRGRKAYDVGFILFLEFFMSVISAAGTPASLYALGVLGHRREVGLVGFTTMYLLGQALGVVLLSPYLDKFGRRTLYIASAFLYSVFCLPVAATSNLAGVFVGRLITGFISAIPAITTRRSIEDLFGAEGRMWAFFSWALVTNLGLVIGPIYASYVSISLDWRWPFYLATIIVACTGIMIYFIRESHTSQLLELKVTAIQSHRADLILRTAPTPPRPSIFQPVTLLFTNPIVFLSSLTNAFSTALLYLFAVAFPLIYPWSQQKSTLIFLFIALGLLLSTLTQFHSRHIIRKSNLSNHPTTPERNLSVLFIAAPALAIALWWFAWTIPNSATVNPIPWPASATSVILLGYGINSYSTSLPRYLLSSNFSKNDASAAFAAQLVAKALLSAVFPLFTQQLFDHLSHHVAGSVLAAIATAFCFVLFVLFRFGERWRGCGSGSVSNGCTTDDGEKEEEEDKMVEEGMKTCKKQRKTVRWGDEMGDSSCCTESSSEIKESEDRAVESENRTPETESESEDRTSGSSDLSSIETETETETEKAAATAGSELSRQETQVSRRDFANVDVDENVDNESALSKIATQNRENESESESENENENESDEIARMETKSSNSNSDSNTSSSSSSSSADNADNTENTENKKKKEKKKEKKTMSSVDDDKDNGAAGGFWGMDLERLAVLPYF